MELRTACSPKDEKYYDTKRLREEFLIDDLFQPDDIKLVYSHIDRIITGSAVPVGVEFYSILSMNCCIGGCLIPSRL